MFKLKINKKNIHLTLLFFIVICFFTEYVYAAPLSYITDTNFLLTTPSITVTIFAGSKADGFVVNATNVTVTMSNTTGGAFTLTSPKAMTSSVSGSGGILTQTCSGGIETETITQTSSSATYTLTPTNSACTPAPAVTSGGPLITGSGYVYVPPVINPITSIISTTILTPTLQPQIITYNFGTTTLKFRSEGKAVKELQRFLNKNLNLNLKVDGVLGLKTIAIIKRWQKSHGLTPDGIVGVKTKLRMNALGN